MKPDPQAMSDAALLEQARLRRWEKRLSRSGCVVGLAVAAAVMVCVIRFFQDARNSLTDNVFMVIVALVAGLVIGGVVSAVIEAIVGRRSGPYQEELKRRHQPKTFETAVQEAEEAFMSARPPGWIMVLGGSALPSGDWRLGRVDLWLTDPPEAHIAARAEAFIDFRREDPIRAEVGEAALLPEDCLRLLAFLRDLDLSALKDVPSGVIDGFPCRVAVLQREPRRKTIIEGNPGGCPKWRRRSRRPRWHGCC